MFFVFTGACRGFGPEGAQRLQEQRHRERGAVSGQERSGSADEIHLQGLREAVRKQQRRPTAVARKGTEFRLCPETWRMLKVPCYVYVSIFIFGPGLQ